MDIVELKTPIRLEDIRSLNIGDIIYLTGTLITARDGAHRRLLKLIKSNERLPLDFDGKALYHCGPIVRKNDNSWEVLSAGPTTSYRMEGIEHEIIKYTGVRVVIGKGGMGPLTEMACRQYGAIYCSFTGGAGLIAAQSIKRVKTVHWLDLGIPEAMWVFEIERFGPLVVSIDSKGNNLNSLVLNEARSIIKI
ncbi:MAG TPA: fumarate hydratase [Thermoplasmatales archaeon]|nr:fumarate hydratase [Thermoplasmatales archaeon]